jgi:hypothetical protein
MTSAGEYRPSGKVDWLRLFFAAVLGLVLIAILCDIAFRLDRTKYYPPLLGAIVFGVAAAMIAIRVVEWGRCRSVAVGRTVGVIAVLAFQLGFYQRSLIDARTRGSPDGLRGVPIAELFSGLPNYIALRMQNFEVSPTVAASETSRSLMTALCWAVFVMEVAVISLVGWFFGGAAARRPFAEKRWVWMTAKRYALPAGTGQAVLDWIEGRNPSLERKNGDLEDVVLLEHDPKGRDEDGYASILVGGRDARRSIARRTRVPSERLEEIGSFLAAGTGAQQNG